MKINKPTRFIMVRHGETVYNTEKRLQSPKDRLTDKGKSQIVELAKELTSFNINHFISSDETRTVESAEIISKIISVLFVKDRLIREKSSGDFSDKFVKDIDWSQIKGDFFTKKIPNGESVNDVIKRARIFLNKLKYFNNGENVLIISHGSFIRIMFCLITGENIEEILLNYELPNAKIIIISYSGEKWVIERSDIIKK